MMRKPPGGGMGGGMGGPPGGGDMMGKIQQNQSILNPVDAASMKQGGQITPDMKISDYLRTLGIDPEGPLSQLQGAMKNQIGKAMPMNKMKSFAGGGGAPGGAPEPSMDNLMRGM